MPTSSLPCRAPGAASGDQPDIEIIDLLDESVIVFGLDMRVRTWNAEAERL